MKKAGKIGGKFDFKALQKYTNPQAVKDFDAFLDAMPVNVGYNALIAAGIAWVIAGAAVTFTSLEVQKVSELRAELMQIEALTPPIPELKYIPVPKTVLEDLAKKTGQIYSGITILANTDGKVAITAADTDYFPQFMAVINTFQNGGANWKVAIDTFCVGRDCPTQKLSAELKIDTVRVNEPAPPVDPSMEGKMEGEKTAAP